MGMFQVEETEWGKLLPADHCLHHGPNLNSANVWGFLEKKKFGISHTELGP